MDGFTGFKTAATEELPDAVTVMVMVMDPFNVVRLAADDVLAYFDRPAPATAPPRPSTAASNTSAALLSASDPAYTLESEAPRELAPEPG